MSALGWPTLGAMFARRWLGRRAGDTAVAHRPVELFTAASPVSGKELASPSQCHVLEVLGESVDDAEGLPDLVVCVHKQLNFNFSAVACF
jgi:hypothetical protein